MAGTGFHPEGHVTRPYNYPSAGPNQEICVNCAEVDPKPGTECIDDC